MFLFQSQRKTSFQYFISNTDLSPGNFLLSAAIRTGDGKESTLLQMFHLFSLFDGFMAEVALHLAIRAVVLDMSGEKPALEFSIAFFGARYQGIVTFLIVVLKVAQKNYGFSLVGILRHV